MTIANGKQQVIVVQQPALLGHRHSQHEVSSWIPWESEPKAARQIFRQYCWYTACEDNISKVKIMIRQSFMVTNMLLTQYAFEHLTRCTLKDSNMVLKKPTTCPHLIVISKCLYDLDSIILCSPGIDQAQLFQRVCSFSFGQTLWPRWCGKWLFGIKVPG